MDGRPAASIEYSSIVASVIEEKTSARGDARAATKWTSNCLARYRSVHIRRASFLQSGSNSLICCWAVYLFARFAERTRENGTKERLASFQKYAPHAVSSSYISSVIVYV